MPIVDQKGWEPENLIWDHPTFPQLLVPSPQNHPCLPHLYSQLPSSGYPLSLSGWRNQWKSELVELGKAGKWKSDILQDYKIFFNWRRKLHNLSEHIQTVSRHCQCCSIWWSEANGASHNTTQSKSLSTSTPGPESLETFKYSLFQFSQWTALHRVYAQSASVAQMAKRLRGKPPPSPPREPIFMGDCIALLPVWLFRIFSIFFIKGLCCKYSMMDILAWGDRKHFLPKPGWPWAFPSSVLQGNLSALRMFILE